ncbi:beta-1,3-galactosyltransferase 1-like [Hoplias malabaricus]|uniref:beta-1,3-galactosyltransferase 1-like n=1 Tax=Hoplias malabaricus TaxID=27720 RepID=UPI003462544E
MQVSPGASSQKIILRVRAAILFVALSSFGGPEKQPGRFKLCRFRPRNCFLLLLVSILLIFYYIYYSEAPDICIINKIYNTTNTGVTSPATFPITPTEPVKNGLTTEAPATTITTTTTTTVEQCTAETKYHVAYPCSYQYIINEPDICQQDDPFLVLMVPVAPSNREARDAIRDTWGSEKVVKDKVVRHFFVLGQSGSEGREEQQQKLLQESEENHDIIQSDFLDSYNNLTIKTMIIMEWLASHCRNASYGMKIDSDIFLNLENLINLLLNAPRQNYITGHVAINAIVIRNPQSKWYFPKEVFTDDYYPTYALGLGYVFSLDLPEKLINGSKSVKNVYIEDVNTGLILKHVGISYSYSDNSLFSVSYAPYDRCRFSKLFASLTNSVEDQVNSWKDLKKPEPPCQ